MWYVNYQCQALKRTKGLGLFTSILGTLGHAYLNLLSLIISAILTICRTKLGLTTTYIKPQLLPFPTFMTWSWKNDSSYFCPKIDRRHKLQSYAVVLKNDVCIINDADRRYFWISCSILSKITRTVAKEYYVVTCKLDRYLIRLSDYLGLVTKEFVLLKATYWACNVF